MCSEYSDSNSRSSHTLISLMQFKSNEFACPSSRMAKIDCHVIAIHNFNQFDRLAFKR
jgi:hypothetical protein